MRSPAAIPQAVKHKIKKADKISAWLEAVQLAGFTLNEADSLRKAMGKKKKALLDQMLPKFINGGTERGHPEDVLNKVWKDWEAFAAYAFNKSHSTCYSIVAYQTAYQYMYMYMYNKSEVGTGAVQCGYR